jgi:hypothetical protein
VTLKADRIPDSATPLTIRTTIAIATAEANAAPIHTALLGLRMAGYPT